MKNMQLNGNLPPSASMDFAMLDQLKNTLNDSCYVEYIFHKLYNSPDAQFSAELHNTWSYPECWLARYYCYYVLHQHLITDARILDLGSNLNFYSVWATINGAKHVDCIEPDPVRYQLGHEYVKLRGLDSVITTAQLSIDQYMQQYNNKTYDVVFFLDVMYYLTNGINVLEFIKQTIKPKFLFFESSVVDDIGNSGHFDLWTPSTNTTQIESFKDSDRQIKLALKPSRNALHAILEYHGWETVFYYDYHDFIGRGESPPRKNGKKSFYVLKNLDS